jgi:hypothetical protein
VNNRVIQLRKEKKKDIRITITIKIIIKEKSDIISLLIIVTPATT